METDTRKKIFNFKENKHWDRVPLETTEFPVLAGSEIQPYTKF